MKLWSGLTRSLSVPAARYPPDPRALFVLIMCVVVSVPLLFANATPGSIASRLAPPLIVAWGVMLCGGSLVTLIGALRQTPNGVIAEQVGSISLGFACLIYAFAIWLAVGVAGTVPLGLSAAYGLASIWRYFQLRAYLRGVEEIAQAIRQDE